MRYFSNIGTIVAMLGLFLTIFLPYDLTIHTKPGRLALVHLSITVAVFMQLIILPVFWTVLAPIAYKR